MKISNESFISFNVMHIYIFPILITFKHVSNRFLLNTCIIYFLCISLSSNPIGVCLYLLLIWLFCDNQHFFFLTINILLESAIDNWTAIMPTLKTFGNFLGCIIFEPQCLAPLHTDL